MRAVGVAVDILPLLGTHHAHRAVFVEDHYVVPHAGFFSGEQGGEAYAGQGGVGGTGESRPFEDGGEQIVVADKLFAHGTLPGAARVAPDQGHLHRRVVHIHGEGAVALAEDAVMAHAHAVVQGIGQLARGLQGVEDPTDARVHGGDGREIPLQIGAAEDRHLFGCLILQVAPGVGRHVGHRGEGTAVVQVVKRRRVMLPLPGGVGRGVMHA